MKSQNIYPVQSTGLSSHPSLALYHACILAIYWIFRITLLDISHQLHIFKAWVSTLHSNPGPPWVNTGKTFPGHGHSSSLMPDFVDLFSTLGIEPRGSCMLLHWVTYFTCRGIFSTRKAEQNGSNRVWLTKPMTLLYDPLRNSSSICVS